MTTPTNEVQPSPSLCQAVAAEGLGTALLLAIVVGSGIMAQQLSQGNIAVALLANTLSTGAGLFVLIQVFAPLSGAHFNPAVSLVQALDGKLAWRIALLYIVAQGLGGVLGVWLAHGMFDLPILQASSKVRSSTGQWLAEGVATFGLVFLILRVQHLALSVVAGCVALYITSAYWFTASTSFANPAVTLARSFTDTFAGIRLGDAPAFIVAQMVGAGLAIGCARFFATRTTV